MTVETKFTGLIKWMVPKGRWIHGDLIKIGDRRFIFLEEETLDRYFMDNLIEVIPESVGQFTGMKDKNKKDLYGGHIAKVSYQAGIKLIKSITGEITFEEGAFWVEGGEALCDYSSEQIEIIGNKTENAELLK